MSQYQNNSIFWVEVGKISPNPYQPRHEFDQSRLADLAESIRQYGILQPLVVTRKETQKEDGGLRVGYELVAGERRLRASKLAGLTQVPVIIRTADESNQMKLELAIIENLQREDLNPIDRAKAFEQLAKEFNFKHNQIAKKVGKSREYVSNTLRLLTMPEYLQEALGAREITEGHTRPLMMLNDRPDEQEVLFKEIIHKKLTVREAESISRRIARDKARKKMQGYSPEIISLEQQLTETLGTRVHIETREVGGKVVIDYFSNDDLRNLLESLNKQEDIKMTQPAYLSEDSADNGEERLEQALGADPDIASLREGDAPASDSSQIHNHQNISQEVHSTDNNHVHVEETITPLDDSTVADGDDGDLVNTTKESFDAETNDSTVESSTQSQNENQVQKTDDEDELYSISKFSI